MPKAPSRKKTIRKPALGAWGFYHWRGEAYPALVTRIIPDSDGTIVSIAAFTPTGVMNVPRLDVGDGDAEWGHSANPAVGVVDDDDDDGDADGDAGGDE